MKLGLFLAIFVSLTTSVFAEECELAILGNIVDLRQPQVVAIKLSNCGATRIQAQVKGTLHEVFDPVSGTWLQGPLNYIKLPQCAKYIFLKIYSTDIVTLDVSVNLLGDTKGLKCTYLHGVIYNTAREEGDFSDFSYLSGTSGQTSMSLPISLPSPNKRSRLSLFGLASILTFAGACYGAVQCKDGSKT